MRLGSIRPEKPNLGIVPTDEFTPAIANTFARTRERSFSPLVHPRHLCVKFIRHRHSISCICRWSRDGYFGSSHKIFPIGIINFLLCLHQIILNLLMCQMKQSDSVPTRIFSTGMRCTRVAGRIKNESWMPSLNKTENC